MHGAWMLSCTMKNCRGMAVVFMRPACAGGRLSSGFLQDIDISERISQAPKQRISIYCIAESLDRKLLEKRLQARGPSWLVSKYPDVLYGQYTSLENPTPTGVCVLQTFLQALLRL